MLETSAPIFITAHAERTPSHPGKGTATSRVMVGWALEICKWRLVADSYLGAIMRFCDQGILSKASLLRAREWPSPGVGEVVANQEHLAKQQKQKTLPP